MAARPRFVNLNKTRTYVPGPDGQQVIVMPFEDTLNDHTRRPDAVYVVEGEWWRQFVGGSGPLFPFPAPREYGLDAFPTLVGKNYRISAVPLPTDGAADASGSSVAAVARMGRPRLAGDVITPDGKIRKVDTATGQEILVDDTPENRHLVHSEIARSQGAAISTPSEDRNAPLRRSIIDELERLGIDSHVQFAALPDETLLRIPGINSQNLPILRKNTEDLLKRIARQRCEEEEADEDEDNDAPTPDGLNTRTDSRPSEAQGPAESVSSQRRAKKKMSAKKRKKASRRRSSND